MIDPHARVMGLPLYLWAIGLAGAIGVGIYLRRKNAAKNSGDGSGSNDTADATDPSNQDDFGDVGSGLGGGGGFNEAPPPAGTTNNDDLHLDNEILALLRKERREQLKARRDREKRNKKHHKDHKHHPKAHTALHNPPPATHSGPSGGASGRPR